MRHYIGLYVRVWFVLPGHFVKTEKMWVCTHNIYYIYVLPIYFKSQ